MVTKTRRLVYTARCSMNVRKREKITNHLKHTQRRSANVRKREKKRNRLKYSQRRSTHVRKREKKTITADVARKNTLLASGIQLVFRALIVDPNTIKT